MRLDSFYVESYRGIKDINLEGFTNTNIFVGKNNSGKTSLLEAMILSGLFDDAQLLVRTLISRYQEVSIDQIESMFDVREHKKRIHLEHTVVNDQTDERTEIITNIVSGEMENLVQNNLRTSEVRRLMLRFEYEAQKNLLQNKKQAVYRIDFTKENSIVSINTRRLKKSDAIEKIPCQFISFSRFDGTNFLMTALDEILEQEKRDELIEVLRIFDSRVRGFEVVGEERKIKIFRDGEETPLSLYDYGNGMYKAFYIASAALLSENGILLIDEIEAGIHHEALGRFVGYLQQVCKKKNIQMFITTHSLETLDLFLQYHVEGSRLDKLTVFNIRNTEEQTLARKYSGERLLDLRNDMGLDIR